MHKDTAYVNKLVKKREHERFMEYHLGNIRHAKPLTRSPEPDPLHINNSKKEYQKEVRFTEIERENRILLEKITGIMGKNKRKSFNETSKTNKSLNSGFRRRQLQGIEVENAKFLKRLQEKKSDYETTKYKEDWKKQMNAMKIMANYPFILTDRPRPKRHSIAQLNHKTRMELPEDTQLVRVRVLNGISFLVTVRLTPKVLQITGDCKERKELKVIEIQKSEAMEFIEEQCQGRLENIFDRLRYDTDEAVLYLLGNDVDLEEVVSKEEIRNRKPINVKEEDSHEEQQDLDERQVQTANIIRNQKQEKAEEAKSAKKLPTKQQPLKEQTPTKHLAKASEKDKPKVQTEQEEAQNIDQASRQNKQTPEDEDLDQQPGTSNEKVEFLLPNEESKEKESREVPAVEGEKLNQGMAEQELKEECNPEMEAKD